MLPRILIVLALAATAAAQQAPPPAAAPWWQQTTALANDGMEGRDTGTEAYERAARYVAARFKDYGLQPAGDNGTWFERVPMHQVDLDTAHSSATLNSFNPNGSARADLRPILLLEEMTLAPRANLPAEVHGRLIFTGYGTPPADDSLRGNIAVYFNNTLAGQTPAERTAFLARRTQSLIAAGAVALISIDNPATTEPTHWPAAYARTVTLRDDEPGPSRGPNLVQARISAESAGKLFTTSAQSHGYIPYPKILEAGKAGDPLPTFGMGDALSLKLAVTQKNISSPNILAILPGSDKTLAPEYIALSAHLDGYGYGTPVLGDKLYNGALDDAAYVATLLEEARTLKSHPPARSLLFCIFTGEEKGLLGSQYFTHHLTVPANSIVADLNLDQLRPIFPLKILTMEGLTDSSIGNTARTVAGTFGIELRTDREPERNLFRRADNFNFVRIGVPIGSFIFGYNPGTPEERAYRDWYARRYHKPQDDLATPIDWQAAVTFNDFFRALTVALADAPTRPLWNPLSPNAPIPAPKISAVPPGCSADTQGRILKCH